MAPQFTSLGLCSYRSFGQAGIDIPVDKKFAILIGANNAGKSNAIRLLHHTRVARNSGTRPFDKLLDGHPGLDEDPHVVLTWPAKHFKQPNPQLFELNNITHIRVRISARTSAATLVTDLSVLGIDGLFHWSRANFNAALSGGTVNDHLQYILNHLGEKAAREFEAFTDKLLVIPDVRRIHKAGSEQASPHAIDGRDIIAKINEMQHPDFGHEQLQDQFNKLEIGLAELLNEPKLKLEIPNSKSTVMVRMRGKRLPVENYGMGMHELIIMCCGIVLHPGYLVCIEEPELHLHPTLQRRFFDFLRRHTDNQFLISTHASTFLDLSDDVSIVHVRHSGDVTKSEAVAGNSVIRRVLDDLGCKASDMLQANGVIWVEGPSDRVLLRKWIGLVAPELREGIEFAVMFYGGSNLANVGASDEDPPAHLVDLLKINRNCFVVMDSDSHVDGKPLSARKQAIVDALGPKQTWISAGREVENYLSEGLLSRFLSKRTGANTSVKLTPTGRIQAALDEATMRIKKRVDYQSRKNDCATEIAELIHEEDIDVLDLRDRVLKLAALIREWNLPGVGA